MRQPEYTLVQVLAGRWWIGVVSLIVSLVATPIVRFIAYRARIVDRPDDLLKPHGRPVAYLGGVAMCIGLLVGVAAYVSVMPDLAGHWSAIGEGLSSWKPGLLHGNPLWSLLGIALASVVVALVGLSDDLLNIKPGPKVLGQVAAAAILMVFGVGDRMAVALLPSLGFTWPLWVIVPLSVGLSVVIVIAACNATNLLDGLDGLCGGVTAIITLGFLALAVWLAMWNNAPGTDGVRVALCLAMAGAVIGFLPYNIPPASIFMGDAGSMLLGFFVATMMVLFCLEGSTSRWFAASLMVFALPILDTGLAVIRRFRAGKSIFAGDRSHLYDQLVDRGMSVKAVVGLFYLLAAITAVIGVVGAIFLRVRYAAPVYALLFLSALIVFHRLGMITPPSKAGPADPAGKTPASPQ